MDSAKLMGIFIIGIMVLSVFGIIANSQFGSNDHDYNGFEFKRLQNGMWLMDEKYTFTNHPSNLEHLNVTDIQSPVQLIVSIDPGIDPALSDLIRFEFAQAPVYVEYLHNASCDTNIPVLILQKNLTTEVILKDKCITIRSNEYNLFSYAERVLYNLMGVI